MQVLDNINSLFGDDLKSTLTPKGLRRRAYNQYLLTSSWVLEQLQWFIMR